MKTIVTEFQFVEAFRLCGRESQFSLPARRALFEYLEEYENSIAEEITLDPIGLCCEWSEDTPENIAANYSIDIEDDGNALANVLDHLNDETMVAGVTDAGTIVYLTY